MSLIDTIFGTATTEVVDPDNDGAVEDRTSIDKGRRGAKEETATTTGSTTTTSSDNDNVVTNHQNHHSLFHTIIPVPDRKLEYIDKKKNDRNINAKQHATTTSIPPNKRQKNGDEIAPNVDSDNEGEDEQEEEEEEQHHASNIHSDYDHENHEKNERTIFVGNIPITYTRKHLRQLFLDCGSIQSTRIRGIAIIENVNDDVKNNGNKGRKAQNASDVPIGKKSVVKLPPSLAGQQQIYKKVCINTSNNTTMGIDTTKKQSNIGYVVFHHKDSVEKALLKNKMIVPVGPIPASSLLGTLNTTTPGGDLNNVRHIRVDRCTMMTTTTDNASEHNNNQTLRDPKRTIFIGNLPYHTDEETLHQHILQHMKLDNIEKSSSSSESMNDKNSIIESIRIVRNPTTYLCQGFAYVLFTSVQYVPTALRMLHQTTYMKQVLRIQACKTKTKNDHIMKKSSSSSGSRTSSSPSLSIARSDGKEEHRVTTTRTAVPRASTVPTTKAVGALKRVLQKQQRLLLQDNKKAKTIRKRGPTMSKHKITKKSTSSSKKKKK